MAGAGNEAGMGTGQQQLCRGEKLNVAQRLFGPEARAFILGPHAGPVIKVISSTRINDSPAGREH